MTVCPASAKFEKPLPATGIEVLAMETVLLNDPAVPVPSETATVELALGPRFAVVNEEPPLTVMAP